MNITELTFHPCWTCAVLLEEALWDVEHNHCTYNRSDFAMMWSAGSCVVIKGAIQPDETHFGCLPFVSHLLRCSLVWDSPPRPAPEEEDAPCGCGLFFFLRTTCQSRGRKRLSVGPRGALAVFHVWGTNWWWAHTSLYVYIHTHAHEACSHTHTSRTRCKPIISDTNPQRCRCLDYTELSLDATCPLQCYALSYFHPRTAAPPFCSSHLHRSLCTHNM